VDRLGDNAFAGLMAVELNAGLACDRGLRKVFALDKLRSLSSSAERGRISGRCCSATTPMAASSSMPAVWVQGMPDRVLPIFGAASSR
jgi:hypothetical protein